MIREAIRVVLEQREDTLAYRTLDHHGCPKSESIRFVYSCGYPVLFFKSHACDSGCDVRGIIPVATIAQQLGISRPMVYAHLRRTIPPSPRSPQRSGQVLNPYMPYLIHRWREGITDSIQLWREIRALGYTQA
jgi:hypothetical protein